MWSATSLRNFPSSSRFPVNGFGSFNLTVLSVLNFRVVSFEDSPPIIVVCMGLSKGFPIGPFPLSMVAICFFNASNSCSTGSDSSGAVSKLAVSVVWSKLSRSIVLGSNSVGSPPRKLLERRGLVSSSELERLGGLYCPFGGVVFQMGLRCSGCKRLVS